MHKTLRSTLVTRVFVSYSATLRKRVTLKHSIRGSILIGFEKNETERKFKHFSDLIEPPIGQLGMHNSTGSPIFLVFFTDVWDKISRTKTDQYPVAFCEFWGPAY